MDIIHKKLKHPEKAALRNLKLHCAENKPIHKELI